MDLTALDIVCTPDTAWAWSNSPDSLALAGVFRNDGEGVVDGFDVRIEVDGCIGFWGDTQGFGPLAPGEQDTILAGPFPVEPFQCVASLFVDVGDDVEEVNEENNDLVDVPACVVVHTSEPNAQLGVWQAVLEISPNPTEGAVRLEYVVPIGTPTIQILDASGRLVRAFAPRRQAGSVWWDGRDGHGRAVSTGTYFVRFVALGVRETRRVSLIR
jgi:hypothetical protein